MGCATARAESTRRAPSAGRRPARHTRAFRRVGVRHAPCQRHGSSRWLTYLAVVLVFACALKYVSIYADVTMNGLDYSRLTRELASASNVNTRLAVQAQAMVNADRAKYLGMQAGMQTATTFDHVAGPQRVAKAQPGIK